MVSNHLLFPDRSESVSDLAINWLGKHPDCRDWQMGAFHARHPEKDCCVFEAFDRERRPYWLYSGPWREWGWVGAQWAHLSWVSQTMVSLSPLLRILGPILPTIDWTGVEEGFIGRALRRPGKPFLELLRKQKLGLENLIQLTGFLRLLQARAHRKLSRVSGEHLVHLEKTALRLTDKVQDLIPDQPPFRRWQSFYLQNARSLASSKDLDLTLSLGRQVTKCFSIADNGGLHINRPFFLCQDLAGMDLCRLLIEAGQASQQDRQYLIDFYYNRQVPSHFFTLLAYQHMTELLKKLLNEKPEEIEGKENLEALAAFARHHDGFRVPVPSWYLA